VCDPYLKHITESLNLKWLMMNRRTKDFIGLNFEKKLKCIRSNDCLDSLIESLPHLFFDMFLLYLNLN
jgi:hypothetical protein